MKRLLITMLLLGVCMYSFSMGRREFTGVFFKASDIPYELKAIERLESVSRWLIEEGMFIYGQEGRKELIRQIEERVSLKFGDIFYNEGMYPIRYLIFAKSTYYDIVCMYRIEGPMIYEYWTITIISKVKFSRNNQYFIITKTDHEFGKRELVKITNQFFEKYVDDDIEFILPYETELNILSLLEAHINPNNYDGNSLPQYRAVPKGKYPDFWFEKKKLPSREIRRREQEAALGIFWMNDKFLQEQSIQELMKYLDEDAPRETESQE